MLIILDEVSNINYGSKKVVDFSTSISKIKSSGENQVIATPIGTRGRFFDITCKYYGHVVGVLRK